MKVGNQGQHQRGRRRHGEGVISWYFHQLRNTLKGFANVTKKDDDFGYRSNAQKRDVPFLYRMANWNPVLLICVLTALLIFFTLLLLWLLTVLFSGYGGDSNVISEDQLNLERKAFKDLMRTSSSKQAIDDLLKEMEGTENDIAAEMLGDWDQKFAALLQQRCLRELSFRLDTLSIQTLEAHTAYLFTSLQSRDILHWHNPDTTVVTKVGTIVDKEVPENAGVYGEPCSLITELLKMAENAKIMVKPTNKDIVDPEEEDLFSKTNDDAWQSVEQSFVGKDMHESAYQLISMAKDTGKNLHLAKQILPSLMTKFCPNIYKWFEEKKKKEPSAKIEEKKKDWLDPGTEALSSIDDLLRQLHRHGFIHLEKKEIPAFDRNGYLVAVDQFALNENQSKFSDKWTSCAFVDKIAYYRNVGIEKQSEALVNAAETYNYFAFDNQADIMMIEHCPKTKAMLTSDKKDAQPFDTDDIYRNIFRGELLDFGFDIANNEFVGDAKSFVVTESGGIMHRDEAERRKMKYGECEIIKHMAATSKNRGGNGEKYDEDRFNPLFHGKRHDALEKELKEKQENVDAIAESLVNHALNDETYELRRMVTNTMYKFHPKEMRAMGRDKVEMLLSEINQYIVALVNMDTLEWPENHVTLIDLSLGNLNIVNKDLFKRDPNLLVSKVFNQIFKKALHAKRKPKPKDSANRMYDETRKQRQSDNRGRGYRDGSRDAPRDRSRDAPRDESRNAPMDERMRSYVSVLLRDIRTQQRDRRDGLSNALLDDIDDDLKRYCPDMMGQLNRRGKRMLVSNLLAAVADNRVFRDPVVTMEGEIVDGRRELSCPFVTELLAQSN